MFNIPPNRRNMANPLLQLLIPPAANKDSHQPTAGSTNHMSPMGPSLTQVPRSGGPLRRKPPAIDFSKIDGLYSFSPSTSDASASLALKQYTLATSESSRESRESLRESREAMRDADQRNTNQLPSNRSQPPFIQAQSQAAQCSQMGENHAQLLTVGSVSYPSLNQHTSSHHQTNHTTSHSANHQPSHASSHTPSHSIPISTNHGHAPGSDGSVSIADLTQEEWNTLANSNGIREISKLGEGNGGSVSKCMLRSGSPVFALKLINADPNPEVQKQIIRELQYNRLCHCQNIVSYYGTFMIELQSMIGIAMEYMGGGSLDAIYKRVIELDSTNRVNEKVLGKIAESVLRGLSYLHLQRIIHRDIKPSNILLDAQGHVKICDFGVSGDVVNSLATTFVGTQYYMAPERIMGKPYTVSCDVWSLGLSLLEVAQGKFPYHYQNENPMGPIELLSLILEYEPHLQDVPEEEIFWSDSFKNFIDYCLKKNAEERPSPRQMLQHPWCVGQQQAVVNMAKFVKRLWGDNLE